MKNHLLLLFSLPLAVMALPAAAQETLTDVDGNTYQTIEMNGQTWMAGNLRTTRYADGTPVDSCWCYGGDQAKCEEYGRIYAWPAAMKGDTTANVQGVCPDGWHLPAKEDWLALIDHFGPAQSGTELKVKGSTGFDARYGGYRFEDGSFNYEGEFVYFWTSSRYPDEPYTTHAWHVFLGKDIPILYRNINPQARGHYVRCVKD
jgi:uncharacterized protein (TIGR02145 family)